MVRLAILDLKTAVSTTCRNLVRCLFRSQELYCLGVTFFKLVKPLLRELINLGDQRVSLFVTMFENGKITFILCSISLRFELYEKLDTAPVE